VLFEFNVITPPSFPRLRSIIRFAQHLAVRCVRLPALVPRFDVVAFHLFKLKMLLAFYADAFLSLVCLSLHVFGERADVQVSFVAIEDIRVDAGLPIHIFIEHQLR
jgi:hypothetical protein